MLVIHLDRTYSLGMKQTKAKPCPHCGKPAVWEDNPFRPFCSERCRLIDLGKWASEKYRIPGHRDDSAVPDEGESDETKGEGEGK